MPKEHPLAAKKHVTLAQIAHYPLILPAVTKHAVRGIEALFDRYGQRPLTHIALDDWELIRKYVEAGLGLSIISAAGWLHEEKMHAVSLEKYFSPVTYGITLRRGKPILPHIQAWIDTMSTVRQCDHEWFRPLST